VAARRAPRGPSSAHREGEEGRRGVRSSGVITRARARHARHARAHLYKVGELDVTRSLESVDLILDLDALVVGVLPVVL
jgi:hypothetical protein